MTHLIGRPEHPDTLLPHDLAAYQMEFFSRIQSSSNHKFHAVKSRQIGFTELMIRILQYKIFHEYQGKLVVIVAGTREKTTKEIFGRFMGLFHNIPWVIKERKGDLHTVFTNGTVAMGLPANPEAITGLTKVAAIFVDEAAKFNLIDDLAVMNAIKPIVEINHSDLFMISTPKGRSGFFYNIREEDNDFEKVEYPIWDGVPEIYSEERAKEMLEDTTLDTEQEYLCKFTTARGSIFGSEFVNESYEEEDYA